VFELKLDKELTPAAADQLLTESGPGGSGLDLAKERSKYHTRGTRELKSGPVRPLKEGEDYEESR